MPNIEFSLIAVKANNAEQNKAAAWTPTSHSSVPKSPVGVSGGAIHQATSLSSPPLPGPYSTVLTPTSTEYHSNHNPVSSIDSKPPLTASLF